MKLKDKLNEISRNIKPLTEAPITVEFFNGENYEAVDGSSYPGYTPVVVGKIVTDITSPNYNMSEEKFKQLAIDAFYDTDAYVNKAMTVLGVFKDVPNFSSIPAYTKDMLMRAIAATVEQALWTNPANAELKVTLTSTSGGRTNSVPARENFNPGDKLNQKVKEYLQGSMIVELLKDSFKAIELDRNDYYTKEEIEAIFEKSEYAIENLFTNDVDNWEPTEDGDGVNKKYVDKNDEFLQTQINGLVTGDIELYTDNIKAKLPLLESYTGTVDSQEAINIENVAIGKVHTNKIEKLEARLGSPLQAKRTLFKEVDTNLTIIDEYDSVINGTIDSLGLLNETTGKLTIKDLIAGDQVSIEASFVAQSKPLPFIASGKAYLYKNDEIFIHPVTGLPVETTFVVGTTVGAMVSLKATEMAIRPAGTGNGELEVGDVLDLRISQTLQSAQLGFPLNISDIKFDLVINRQLSTNKIQSSTDAIDTVSEDESLSGIASNQKAVNEENKIRFGEIEQFNQENETLTLLLEKTSGQQAGELSEDIENFREIYLEFEDNGYKDVWIIPTVNSDRTVGYQKSFYYGIDQDDIIVFTMEYNETRVAWLAGCYGTTTIADSFRVYGKGRK